jgi:hypothetical protein
MAEPHYLGFPGFVIERLYQVAECQGRLRFLANHARFLILPGVRHSYVSVLTITLAAIAAGCTHLLAIGEWATGLTQDQ